MDRSSRHHRTHDRGNAAAHGHDRQCRGFCDCDCAELRVRLSIITAATGLPITNVASLDPGTAKSMLLIVHEIGSVSHTPASGQTWSTKEGRSIWSAPDLLPGPVCPEGVIRSTVTGASILNHHLDGKNPIARLLTERVNVSARTQRLRRHRAWARRCRVEHESRQ